MEIAALLDALDSAGHRLAEAADRRGLTAEAPHCPGWRVRDVVAHTGGVHHWAASFVITGRTESYTEAEEAEFLSAPETGLTDWYRAMHARLVESLRAADPALDCWSFLPAPSPIAFWARRQAHEATIHSLDAGAAADFAPEFAVDGINELLTGFFSRRRRRHADDPPLSVGLRTTDTDDHWTVRVQAGVAELITDGASQVTVAGTAADLYRLLWNRLDPDDLELTGDRSVLDQWRARMRITWA
ncbi:maleylpyruvate isomerase family mycothiol-dependent enzyme [Microlunatus sp. GCM10028923]|uniref:maleylpyruvate isomerase family mycothiol-dependent enzyme n=1 Tax=Microlunatus sp. GCM10028923 TaxID=3273400 RepID=UPI00361D7115